MNIELKILKGQETNDFIELINIFSNVFKMKSFKMPKSIYLENLLSKPDFKVLVAKYNNRVVGGLTVYILHNYFSTNPTAYIYDVGVMTDYQRQGIGKKIIAYLVKYCKENGFENAYVEAETADIEAVNFYKTTSASSLLQATHFTYSFNSGNTEKVVPTDKTDDFI